MEIQHDTASAGLEQNQQGPAPALQDPEQDVFQASSSLAEPAKIKRQPLSCLKCRQRKVKCDRVKPCQACCVRGQPRECEFVVGETDDSGPINQAHEIRRLRMENARLRAANVKIRERSEQNQQVASNEHAGDESASLERRSAPKIPRKPARFQQKRFKTHEASDSLYFGSPGLANVIADFANLQIGSGHAPSVTHAAPRGLDIFAYNDAPLYAFPTLWRADAGVKPLVDCLPPKDELFGYLDAFQCRAQSCSFPHVPEEITKKEVERFLSNAEDNAFKHPDMLALIFAALAQGLQNGVYDKYGGEWVEGAMDAEGWKGDLYIAAAMHALRMASFMSRPNLLGVQTLIMIGPYLTNSGKFLDAWTLFGTTIRVAQSMGLHRSPQHLDPAPLLSECSVRQALWWWMLHMDQQYSMTLGRPLGISGIGDCPPPEPLTTNPTILRVSEYINNFTLLARQVLSSDRLTNGKIDDFTDRLLALRDTLPDIVQFDSTWLDQDKPIPEWPLDAIAAVFHGKTHNYLILLNRQRQENDASDREHNTSSGSDPSARNTESPDLPTSSSECRGRERVLASARALLEAFEFFHSRVRAAMVCWTMGQQAFNASMILIYSLLRPSSRQSSQESIQYDYRIVHQAYATFTEMHQKGIHKLAGLACAKLSPLLMQLGPVPSTPATTAAAGVPPVIPTQHLPTVDPNAFKMPDATAPGEDVMGNTGMVLLEDPGLQSFIPEAFQPLTFQMAGSNLPASGMGDVNMSQGDTSTRMDTRSSLNTNPFMASGAGLSSPGWSARAAPRNESHEEGGYHSGLDQMMTGSGNATFSGSSEVWNAPSESAAGIAPGGAYSGPGFGGGGQVRQPSNGRPEIRQKPATLRATGPVTQA